MAEDQEDEPQQEKPDPNVYQPDQEEDDIELDRRIRRTHERLKRMTMVGFPQINETFGCQDTLTVEGGFETGWAINYIDCGKQRAREGPPITECHACPPDSITLTLAGVNLCGGCIELTGIGAGLSVVVSAGDINGTYELPVIGISESLCCYQLFADVVIDMDVYFGSSCDVFFGTFETGLVLWAGRFTESCQWVIYAYLLGSGVLDQLLVFRGNPQTGWSFSNAAVCGPGVIFSHPCSTAESEGTVGEDGTATLSI